jgi:transmembrane sensor
MDQQRLAYLLEQHRLNRLTPPEQQELDAWYDQLDDPDVKPLYADGTPEAQRYAEEQARLVTNRVQAKQRKSLFQPWMKVAAAIVGLLGLALMSLFIYRNAFSYAKQLPAVVHYEVTNSQVIGSRNVGLPDSSVVILHAGSQLQVDTARFNVKGREVTLTGEAYFDIAHNPGKPFVIKVNDLKVTVLGTAFNIKQAGDSVAVTVTRGRVKVERAGKSLGVITANQQISFTGHRATQETVVAANAVTWTKDGLDFNGETFGQIAERLQERYGVVIQFSNEAIKNCKIGASGAFKGTESLQEILDFICPIVNAHYETTKGVVMITGQGC